MTRHDPVWRAVAVSGWTESNFTCIVEGERTESDIRFFSVAMERGGVEYP